MRSVLMVEWQEQEWAKPTLMALLCNVFLILLTEHYHMTVILTGKFSTYYLFHVSIVDPTLLPIVTKIRLNTPFAYFRNDINSSCHVILSCFPLCVMLAISSMLPTLSSCCLHDLPMLCQLLPFGEYNAGYDIVTKGLF